MIRKRKDIGLGVWVALLLMVSCAKNVTTPDKPYKQVLLFYLGTDNNLSDEGYQKLTALKQGWKAQKGYEVLVYLDAADAPPQLIRLNGTGGQEVLQQFDESSSANPAVLRDITYEMQERFPANGYGLILFSHASGWLPKKTLLNPTGLSRVERPSLYIGNAETQRINASGKGQEIASLIIDGQEEMELVDFAQAIPDHAFRFIVLEACFTAGIEVAYELRHKTEYLLTSSAEIVSPGFTPIYGQWIQTLATDEESGLLRFAENAFTYWDQQSGDLRSATLSIIRTAPLERLAQWIKTNVAFVEVDVASIQHFDRYAYRLFFDFEDYYARLGLTDKQRQELNRQLDDIVQWKAATPSFMPYYNGFDIDKHSGLTVYIPQLAFPDLNQAYQRLQWFQETRLNL